MLMYSESMVSPLMIPHLAEVLLFIFEGIGQCILTLKGCSIVEPSDYDDPKLSLLGYPGVLYTIIFPTWMMLHGARLKLGCEACPGMGVSSALVGRVLMIAISQE